MHATTLKNNKNASNTTVREANNNTCILKCIFDGMCNSFMCCGLPHLDRFVCSIFTGLPGALAPFRFDFITVITACPRPVPSQPIARSTYPAFPACLWMVANFMRVTNATPPLVILSRVDRFDYSRTVVHRSTASPPSPHSYP